MSFVKNFLYFLSGTHTIIMDEIEEKVPHERNKRLMLGIMILFSSFLIGFLFFFVINQIFNNYLWAFLICVPLTIMFTLIDSYLISSIRKTYFIPNFITILPRLILSIFIALVVALPLEMKLFEAEIASRISSNISFGVEYDTQIQDYEKQTNEYKKNLSILQEKYIREIEGSDGTKESGIGPVASFLKGEINKVENNLNEAQARRNDLIGQKTKVLTEQNNSFLSKLQVLQTIRKEESSTYFASWLLFLIILLIEINPYFVFLLAPKGAYDMVLDNLLFEEKNETKLEEKEINARIKLPTFKDGFFTPFDSDESMEKLDEIQFDSEAIENDRKFVMRDWKNVLERYGAR